MANLPDLITQRIYLIRGHRVMLDSDLAHLYVEFRELAILRSQIVTLRFGRAHGAHRKYLPFVFTEQGVAMLSSVLKSERAIQVNVEIMRAFVRLKQLLSSNEVLAKKIGQLKSPSL